jgi:thiamine transport system ATP-binding protein
MLETRDVTVFFGSRLVLSDCSIAVAAEEVVALVGPSGSGKSTLLRVIAGILTPSTGDVVVDGTVITKFPTHRRDIGFVFQDEQLFPHRTVSENIGFGLRMHGWEAHRRRQRVGELLDLVGLAGFENRSVTQLSGGEAKRVALARTLAPAPKIVLLDEPLTGLDSELHDQLAVELAQVLRATQTTALLVTHDRREAEVIADRTVAIDSIQSWSS